MRRLYEDFRFLESMWKDYKGEGGAVGLQVQFRSPNKFYFDLCLAVYGSVYTCVDWINGCESTVDCIAKLSAWIEADQRKHSVASMRLLS